MIGWLIIACEIGFWIFIVAGLVTRYIFKQKTIGAILLICTPILDLILLVATVIDLKNGAVATRIHGLAAIYIAVSIVYGHRMIKWADRQFIYRFAGGEKPKKAKKFGAERAKHEREGWYLHGLTWVIGCVILLGMTLYVEPNIETIKSSILAIIDDQNNEELNTHQTFALVSIAVIWTMVLIIDFVISFSYTLFPKNE